MKKIPAHTGRMFRFVVSSDAIVRGLFFVAFLISLLFWCPLRASLLALVFAVGALAWWLSRRTGQELVVWALLFLTPLAPVFGRGALLTALYFFLAVEGGARPTSRGFGWCLPYAALVLALALVGVGPFDWQVMVGSVRSVDDLRALGPAIGSDGIFEALLVIGAAIVCDRVSRSTIDDRLIIAALGSAASLGAVVAVLQRFHIADTVSAFVNQTHFWEHQNRFAGTSSDPNAAAVLSFLLLPPLIHLAFRERDGHRWLLRTTAVVAAPLLVIGAWISGSRTWFFACGVIGLAYFVLTGRRKLVWGLIAGVGVFVAGVTAIDGLGLLDTERLTVWGAPTGLIRVINAASMFQISETFAARNLFLRLAVQAAFDNPIVGVGPGSFIRLVPTYQRILELPGSRWIDNANNFYAQVAAELGSVGLLLFGLTVWLFWRSARDAGRSAMTTACWCSLAGLAAALWFGPHLQFEECAVCAAVIGGILLRRSVPITSVLEEKKPLIPLVTTAAILLAVLIGGRRERGIFPPESDDHGRWWRWTTSEAEFDLVCSCEGRAEIEFAVLHAKPERPVEVVIQSGSDRQQTIDRFDHPRVVKRTFECTSGNAPGRLGGWVPMVRTMLNVNPPWQPAQVEEIGDHRWLGVRVRGSQPAYRWRECRGG